MHFRKLKIGINYQKTILSKALHMPTEVELWFSDDKGTNSKNSKSLDQKRHTPLTVLQSAAIINEVILTTPCLLEPHLKNNKDFRVIP